MIPRVPLHPSQVILWDPFQEYLAKRLLSHDALDTCALLVASGPYICLPMSLWDQCSLLQAIIPMYMAHLFRDEVKEALSVEGATPT